jgi:predicted ATP-binding protein involved in virulence
MIRIERPKDSQPKRLLEVEEAELVALREFFYGQDAKYQRQRKTEFDIDVYVDDEIREQLGRLSHQKCAYCESPLGKDWLVDLFRPRRGSIRAGGRVDSDHYWWLAYRWDNMLPSCYICERNKGSRFPIKGRAAQPEAQGEELDKERPELIDPTHSHDLPEDHLWVDAEGMIKALSDRGDVTIATLDLNRDDLAAQRHQAFEAATDLFVRARTDATLTDEVTSAISGVMPFTLARRSAYERASETAPPVRDKELKSERFSVVQSELIDRDDVTVGPAQWIESVQVKNFMGLRDFKLEFPITTNPEQEPWIILLGQNGAGKSSLLKAVALALANEDERRRLVPDASAFLNRATSERHGYVRVSLNRGDPVELEFRKWDREFHVTAEPPPINLLGYGATRLPSPVGKSSRTHPTRFSVGNLFDPWETLSDAEPWLTDTKGVKPAQFDRLASSLRQLLSLDDDDEIVRYRKKLYIRQGQARVSLRQLSDGYQSVVALAMDIMFNLANDWSLMEHAEGTVLLDEIEVHLHPQWKVNIIDSLRSLFPRLRFIATTHDPLCLSGALDGEIRILERDKEGFLDSRRLDIPKGTRADQVLTGDWFGLSTTVDDDTIDLMEEHRKMLLLPSDQQDSDRRRQLVSELKKRLGSYADTSVDQMAIQAAAQVIKEQDIRSLSSKDRSDAREAIVDMLRKRSS